MGKLINCLTKLLIENSKLEYLSMNKCELDEDAGEALKRGLERNKALKEIHMKENNLYDEGFSAICEVLQSN